MACFGIIFRFWYKRDKKRIEKKNQEATNMALHSLHHPERVVGSTVPRPNEHVDHRQFSEVKVFSHTDVSLVRELGKGHFGAVWEAQLTISVPITKHHSLGFLVFKLKMVTKIERINIKKNCRKYKNL